MGDNRSPSIFYPSRGVTGDQRKTDKPEMSIFRTGLFASRMNVGLFSIPSIGPERRKNTQFRLFIFSPGSGTLSMKKFVALVVSLLGLVVVAALAIPGSPFNMLDGFIVRRNWGPAQHDGRTVDEWHADLNSPDRATKMLAIKAMGAMGEGASKSLPDLAKIMTTDSDGDARIEASLAISKMAPASASVMDTLIKGLQDELAVVRMNALFGIMRLKEGSKPALKALVEASKRPENKERASGFTTTLQETMLVAIGRASAGTPDAVPMLMAFFNNKDDVNLRLAALRGLAEVGPPAKEAAPEFRKILLDKASVNELRQEAFDALERVGQPADKSELVFDALPPAMGPGGGGKGGPTKGGAAKGGMGKGDFKKGDFKKGDFKKGPPDGADSKKGPPNSPANDTPAKDAPAKDENKGPKS